MYFGGVEGGATESNMVICNERGEVVGRAGGPGTNHWVLGVKECSTRVLRMLHEAKVEAGMPTDHPLDCLGLCLSGCEQESSNAELAAFVLEQDSTSAKKIYVASDSTGSLATGAPNGGMVIIAGTGSNALLQTSDGKVYGCGGWGYQLGDEGGAYWIAHRAIKIVFDSEDGLVPCPESTVRVWDLIRDYFAAETRADLLPHIYKHFDKSFFARLTIKLVTLAENGDRLSLRIFREAGAALAAHAAALSARAQGRVRLVCVGSVWHSWGLLKEGMLEELDRRQVQTELEFVKMKVSNAMGAAWLAAKHIGINLPRDDSKYCEVFYEYKPSERLYGDEVYGNGNLHRNNTTRVVNGSGDHPTENDL